MGFGQKEEKLEPSNIAGRNENGTATLENSLEGLGYVKNGVTIWLSNCTQRHRIPKRRENICPHKNLGINVHSSIDHNSPKVETTQILSSDEWI